MARIVLVTGGARSGKSKYAESLYTPHDAVVYIATSRADDKEMRDRIHLHQESRPRTWKTYEGTYDLHQAVSGENDGYLLDCLGVLTSNIMFDVTHKKSHISLDLQYQIETNVVNEVSALIGRVEETKERLVIVTNEVGASVVPEKHIARVYRDILGRVNQRVAALCDNVYLVVCGIPVKIK